jgi:GntR family transcriptional regulator/MocR family aminotransferase
MPIRISLTIDRASKVTLAEQIRRGVTAAINSGVLVAGARLPSWRDLASQLGVARGTVRIAYERLIDAQLVVSATQGGTRVAERPLTPPQVDARPQHERSMFISGLYRDFSRPPAVFQMGVPAQDCFPDKLVSRIRARAVRIESSAAGRYPDPRGELELRREIAAHLAMARGIECAPSQIIITSGFGGGLGLTLRVLGLEGRDAWVEDPSFPLARKGLEIARIRMIPVPVDEHGVDVAYGIRRAPDAALAMVSPGQQAPLGPTLCLQRRINLLNWAAQKQSWIIEDDYLSELQLKGRAAPALASLDMHGRVIYLGSFSKTISPMLRLGFAVVPAQLAESFAEAAACLAPAPGPSVQTATAELMRDGHYMRHLRRMKRIYAQRSEALIRCLQSRGYHCRAAGLAVLLQLPDTLVDSLVVSEAHAVGLAPVALSQWYLSPAPPAGLLLNVASIPAAEIQESCARLCELIERLAA